MLSSSKLFISIITTLIYTSFTSISVAQGNTELTAKQKIQDNHKNIFSSIIKFEPPRKKGKPTSTSAGGSRSTCPDNHINSQTSALPLTPLLPQSNRQWLTIKQSPTFFVYVPPTSASRIFFQIKDEQDQIIDQNLIPISASQGKIIGLQMSEKTKSLNVGQKYQWSVFLLCKYDSLQSEIDIHAFQQSYDLMNEPWVVGYFTRVETPATLNQAIINNPSLESVQQYAQQGLWLETISTLHQMLKQQPENTQLLNTWQKFLEDQGIKKEISRTAI